MWIHLLTTGLIDGATSTEDIPVSVIPTSGGAVNVKSRKTHKPLTEDEARGMNAIGRAMMGLPAVDAILEPIVEPIEIVDEPIVEPIEFDSFGENIGSLLMPNYGKLIEEQIEEDKIDDDILLILAIITAHNS